MKYLDEYRDPARCHLLVDAIGRTARRRWTIMEVCGGQTHNLLRSGIDRLIEDHVQLLHGPGCPVCVTPLEQIDRALAIATRPEVIFCSFGDMLRVPGSKQDLLRIRAGGGDVRIVYSPLDAVRLAQTNPHREVVFFAVGFETTAPATAMAVLQAKNLGLRNFSLLVTHVLVPPALVALLDNPRCVVEGFLAAGHVCAITGYEEYLPLAEKYQVPIVVTGFEPVDLLEGILLTIQQLESGRHEVSNQYGRAVRPEGNTAARDRISQVYEVCDRHWRGMGPIPRSGLALREEYREFDAVERFRQIALEVVEPADCRAGEVLQGLLRPDECSEFGRRCHPEHPLGAPMVSSEGTCSAYWRYRQMQPAAATSTT